MITPVIPLAGPAGLAFIDRTYERQFALFGRDPELTRDIEAFRAGAGGIDSAKTLVKDTRVLRVALGAFGLEDNLPKRAFIRRVLEEGVSDPGSLANRLSDPAWREFAAALDFGGARNRLSSEAVREDLVSRYRTRQFERAIGDVDVSMRLALNFRREAAEIAASPSAENSGWFRIMGSRPLREVVERAFGLPSQFGLLDIDQQKTELERIADARYGERTARLFSDPGILEDVLRRFLMRVQLDSGPSPFTPGFNALTILQAGAMGPRGQESLFTSRFL